MRLAWAVAGCSLPAAADLASRRAPASSLPDLDLTAPHLAKSRGRVVRLEVSKTDSPTCRQKARLLEQRREPFGQKIAVLAILVPPDNQTAVRAFSMRHPLRHPVLVASGQVRSSYRKASPLRPPILLPHRSLMDQGGHIRDDGAALAAPRPREELAAQIAALLK